MSIAVSSISNEISDTIHKIDLSPFVRMCGVYFLCDENDIVIYIGKSISIYQRLASHLFSKEWASDIKYSHYIAVEEKDLDKMETYFINKYRPKYNIKMKGMVKKNVPKKYNKQ
jgi:excinuclease UvrABC nuclease subunit